MTGLDLQIQGPLAAIGEPRDLPLQLVPLAQLLGYERPVPVVPEAIEARSVVSYRNSTTSRFLNLPLDVRHELYKAILGDRIVHVRLPMGFAMSKSWRHVVCQRGQSKHFKSDQYGFRSTSDDWEPRHRICKWETSYDPDTREGSSYWDNERMHLTVLRSCRQVYVEANQILWSTNTFSIHDQDTLEQFMAERTAVQKGYIRHLRLRFDMTQRYQIYRRRALLTPELMRSLSGLHHLILILEDEFPAKLVRLMALTGKSLTEFGGNRIDAGLERFSLLPLKKVEIEVLDCRPSDGEDDQSRDTWKREYAQGIRDCLLGRLSEVRLHE